MFHALVEYNPIIEPCFCHCDKLCCLYLTAVCASCLTSLYQMPDMPFCQTYEFFLKKTSSQLKNVNLCITEDFREKKKKRKKNQHNCKLPPYFFFSVQHTVTLFEDYRLHRKYIFVYFLFCAQSLTRFLSSKA